MTLAKELLEDLYQSKFLSVQKIADSLMVSRASVNKSLIQHQITLRTKSETAYLQHGKKFEIKKQLNQEETILYGIGLGLYWGEGNKVDEYSVQLGNTDPSIILTFVKFLRVICGVSNSDIRYGLQIFNDLTRRRPSNTGKMY